MIASVTLLCKRRGVIRKVAQGVIRAGVAALDANLASLSKEQRVSLIDCLRAVSKGKIFVELEHARLTLQLAHIREREDADVSKASELLSEVTVETIGAMDRFEKVAITLEQARLLLLAGDTIKAAIVGKKVKRVKLAPRPALKLKHCRVMAECHIADGEMLELCNDYYDVFDTPEVNGMPAEVETGKAKAVKKEEEEKKKEDNDGDTNMEGIEAVSKKDLPCLQLSMPGGASEPAWVFALGRVVLFGALAEYSNHQVCPPFRRSG